MKRATIVILFILIFFVALFADTKSNTEAEAGEFNVGPWSSLAILGGLVGIIYDSRKQGRMLGEVIGVQRETKELIKTEMKNVWNCIKEHGCKLDECDKRLDRIEQKQAVEDALKKTEVTK